MDTHVVVALLLSGLSAFVSLCYLGVYLRKDRIRAERLRISEERYRLIVDNQTEFVVKWLPDGSRTFVNESYCKYFGVSEDECLGTSFMPLVLPEFRNSVSRKIASLTPACPEATDEHLSFVAGGGQRWQEWNDRGIFDDRGNLVQLLSTGRDITERKAVEHKLAEARRKNEGLPDLLAKINQLTRQLLDANRQPASGLMDPDRPSRPTGTETLLLVEDEDAVRKMSQLALESLGYTVLAAASGHEAYQIAARHAGPIALLLTDVVMPDMSGRQLADVLRETAPGLKVLFMSGYTSDVLLRHGIMHGAANFLEKPFTPGKLAEKVRSVLDSQVVA